MTANLDSVRRVWDATATMAERGSVFGRRIHVLSTRTKRMPDNELMVSACMGEDGEKFCFAAKAKADILFTYLNGLQHDAEVRRLQREVELSNISGMCGGDYQHIDIQGTPYMPTIEIGNLGDDALRAMHQTSHDSIVELMQLLQSGRRSGNVRMTVNRHSDGHWTASLRLRLGARGNLTLAATASPDEIAWALREQMQRLQRDSGVSGEASVGSIFSAIGKLAKKIARARLFQRIAAAVKAVVRNPIFAKLAGIATSIIPGAALVRTAVSTARDAISAIRSTSPAVRAAARTVLDVIRERARNGDSRASRTLEIMRVVDRGGRPSRGVAKVAGIDYLHDIATAGAWYHRPARSNAQREMERAAKPHTLRDFYLQGLGELPPVPFGRRAAA